MPSASASLPRRPLRVGAATLAGLGIALLIALVFAALVGAAGTSSGGAVPILDLLVMTTIQASLTTVFSLLVGFALAWALNRLRFAGRDLLVGFFASALVTPGLVLAFGILAVWGRSGWINAAAEAAGMGRVIPSIFGLGGIVFAHVVLDGAFAARILLARLDAVPPLRLKSGRSLGLTGLQRLRLIDWPAVSNTLPGLASVIFLIAFTSFPIVLLLGGGPANQTLEVAIYSAVRLDFDLLAAVRLALVQMAVCSLIIAVASTFTPVSAATNRSGLQAWPASGATAALAVLVLAIGLLGYGLPLVAVLAGGIGPSLIGLATNPGFWQAAASSLLIGLVSAFATLGLALALTLGRAAIAGRWQRLALAVPAYAYLAVPAVVLSLGFFILVRDLGLGTERAAPVVVIIANALLSLPFAVATLGPALDSIVSTRSRLIRSLGLSGLTQFRRVEWPLLGRDIGVVLAIAFCFSLGDLGVIALFGTQDFSTLPLMMYRALGSYRSTDAAGIAALLLLLCIAAFIVIPKLTERLADARA